MTGPQSISLSWSTATGATAYTLQCATSSSGPWTQVYSSSGTSYSDTGLTPDTTYYYEVKASDSTGSSAFSSAVSATTSPTVTVASPTNGQTVAASAITISGTATDTGGAGLNEVTVDDITSGSKGLEPVSGTSASYSIGGIVLVLGSNMIDVESFDNGGYHSSVATITVNYSPPIWSGGGSDTDWSDAANWSGATVAAGDDLVFSGSTGLSNTNNLAAGTRFGNLTFAAGAGTFSLGGNGLNLSGVITNNSTNAQTINLALGGSSGLTTTGPGTVILSAANTYTGNTVVNQGKLVVTQPAALPDGGNLLVGDFAANFTSLTPAAVAQAAVPASRSAATVAKAATPGSHRAASSSTAGNTAAIKPLTHKLALPAAWVGALHSDGHYDQQPTSLAAWDAALAEYGQEA